MLLTLNRTSMDQDTHNKSSLLTHVAQHLQKMLHREPAAPASTEPEPKEDARPQRAVTHTLQQVRDDTRPVLQGDTLPEGIAKAMHEYVTEHMSDTELEVTTMAKGLNMGRTSLFTAMHQHYGMTPGNYIIERRMEYACQLLTIGVKASTVAQRCGYSDPKYFGKAFKKRYGMLPSQYAKQSKSPDLKL